MSAGSPVLQLPLDGTRALEASAGTGKTFAITKLYLRLLLERALRVEQILVVTYTIAATQELRARVRRELVIAQHLLDGARLPEPPDETLAALLAAVGPDENARRTAAGRVRLALATFDQAAIYTIHGFCQRVLTEQAFESAQPFVAEVEPDARPWLQAIVDDAWRRATQGGPGWVAYLLDTEKSPEELATALAPYVARRDLAVRGPAGDGDSAAEEAAVRAAWGALCALDPTGLGALEKRLLGPDVNHVTMKVDRIRQELATVRERRQAGWPDEAAADAARFLRATRVAAACRKGCRPVTHPFLDACERLAAALEACAAAFARRRAALRRQILATAPYELDRRKRQRGVLTFDDLLLRLHDALERPDGGDALAACVRERWRVALIDEFQDTDPVQYRIFRRVWGAPGSGLFLVGDPKQAIYAFRGADVYAYLRAQHDVRERLGLAVNHRSDPGLVRAVNTVFRRLPDPFLVPGIEFAEVAPADPQRSPGLVMRGAAPAPLRFWFVAREGERGAVTKGDARPRIAAAVAAEIAGLVAAGARGEATVAARRGRTRPLAGGDVAVLVGSHFEADLVRRALLARGVACVLHSRDSVLATSEADALALVLAAVAEPGREGLVRAALGTDLLGVRGEQLDALSRDEAAWEQVVQGFRTHHDAFREHGLARMLRQLLAVRNVPAQLLPYADGERRLTNVLHLAELLAAEAARRPVGLDGLIAWMTTRAGEDPPDGDERQLRLESDEQLVKIVTIHKSKGLEYPVVYLPFLWDGEPRAETRGHAAFHDPDADWTLTLDLGPDIARSTQELVRREELAERMRLLYVALTRARHACVVAWGAIAGAGTSALGWLLRPPAGGVAVSDAAKRFDAVPDAQLLEDLDGLVAGAAGEIAVQPLPAAAPLEPPLPAGGAESLAARVFAGHLPDGWRVASFTLLTAGRKGTEAPDHDAGRVAAAQRREPCADPLALPGGTRLGVAVHEVFERADFEAADAAALTALAAERLAANGEDPRWAPALAAAVVRTLDTPLDAGGRVRLRGLRRTARLHELEFTYPIGMLDTAGLRARCAAHGFATGVLREAVERFELRPTHGFMRGFIDLVFEHGGRFWLLDWKSNWLGPDPGDYARDRLAAVMARESYWLQYLIYTLAVHRFLGLRVAGYDYDRHFGGVFYLFVRGIDPTRGDGSGIFHDKPPRPLIDELGAWLGSPGGGSR